VEFASTDFDTIPLTVADVGRPGLLLAGFFEHFDARRLQVLGRVEMSYLSQMSQQKQEEIFDRLFAYKIPALLICRGLQPYPACVAMAQKHNVTLLTSQEATSEIQSALIAYMCDELAPRITRHGVLMEIYGEGVLVTGESGMGKSEAAVELLKRGHRLIADDAVEIRKISGNTLVGSSPEVIRNYVELRGIGIINVAKLFGVGAVKDENEINMVVNIEPWNTQASYDRLGMEINYTELLGVKVPMHTIPITPGRNLAVILEVAAMNNRQRKMGYNAALELTEQINRSFDANMGND
jgi:HPr kinase/phosphorylase